MKKIYYEPNAKIYLYKLIKTERRICISKLGHHWFRLLVACSAPSQYMNQWWLINWTPGNKFKWNFIKLQQFSWKNQFENIVCKIAANLSCPPWYVKVLEATREEALWLIADGQCWLIINWTPRNKLHGEIWIKIKKCSFMKLSFWWCLFPKFCFSLNGLSHRGKVPNWYVSNLGHHCFR